MILVETRTCGNALDAERIELKHIEDLNAVLNMTIPSITIEEYLVVDQT